jgi:hypothetical protein
MTPQDLAKLIQRQTRVRLAREYSQGQADAEVVRVVPGPKYTKIDRGTEPHQMSGFLMIENETGVIYGIKGYGKVHKGHCYGTLETADQWYWGEYSPQDKAEHARRQSFLAKRMARKAAERVQENNPAEGGTEPWNVYLNGREVAVVELARNQAAPFTRLMDGPEWGIRPVADGAPLDDRETAS